MVSHKNSSSAGAEQRLRELGIKLPAPPEPFGTYAEAVQTGNLVFLTGMFSTVSRAAKFIGRVGADITKLALDEVFHKLRLFLAPSP
jgi:enamine deaminase RidA (YjgF/YER057c/UK114 family)